MIRTLTGVVVGLALVMASLCGVAIYWMTAPYQVMTPGIGPARTVLNGDKTVTAGGLLLYAPETPICKRLDARGTMSRAFVDGIIYETPLTQETLAVGECRDRDQPSSIMVPNTLPRGHVYHVEGSVEFQVNPLRRIVYPFRTEDFIVD